MQPNRGYISSTFLLLVALSTIGCGRDLERYYPILADASKHAVATHDWLAGFLPPVLDQST
jgi:hypothetical protein